MKEISVNLTTYLMSLFKNQYKPEIVSKMFGDIGVIPLKNIDECSVADSMLFQICDEEAGCLDTNDGFQCICEDLKPVDPKTKSCENRNETRTQSQEDFNPESTLATFEGNQLLKMFSSGNNITSPNIVFSNSRNITKHHKQNRYQTVSDFNALTSYSITVSIVVLLLVLILVLFAIFFTKKLKDNKKRESNRIQMTETLSKCIQQYVTNPNYYSSSPDGPIFKFIRDIELSEEDITFGDEIGEGCFGTVFRGTYKESDSKISEVAIKVLKDKKDSKEDFEREIEIISSFDHKNIIKLIGVVINESNSIPYMVFEYMMCGDLAEVLRNKHLIKNLETNEEYSDNIKNSLITNEQLIWISAQIASGCKYLADNHFVHRDLATRNCLVGDNLVVKISDFGMARDIYTCDYYKVGGSKLLPVRWMSPESILYGKFTLESDIWSFGVVLWEIFTLAKQPYFGHNNEEVVKLILQGILLIPPEDCPKIIYELMAGCWKTEPIHRLNFKTILNKLIKNCSEDKQKLLLSETEIKIEVKYDSDDYFTSNRSTSPSHWY